ncbi:MAG: mechanosensitive ion channel family protein [Patescibacteria group bacterium]
MLEQFKEIKKIEILEEVFLGNTVFEYIIFLSTVLVLFFIIKILEKVLLGRLKAKNESFEKKLIWNLIIDFILSIKTSFYLYLALFISLSTIQVSDLLMKVFTVILTVWIAIRLMLGLQSLVDYILNKKLLNDSDPEKEVVVKNVGTIIKVLLWIFAGLLLLSNFGVKVTSLVAGLGIGGIAIAFALQSVLEDLFSSFSIYLDKPFTVGDFIVVDDKTGTVEKIGIKTTRIRALQGEEIVVSNKELTNSKIHNFKKLNKRRSLFEFGVVYGTSNEKMEEIPKIVKQIIESQDMTEFDRVHFKGFGDSALEFEVSYYVLSPEYMDYRNVHEKVLLEIKRRFNEKEIEMAFPTRTVHLFNK